MPRRDELTDVQWETIRDLLLVKEGDPGRTAVDNRLFVNAVLIVLKAEIRWEDLSGRYGTLRLIGAIDAKLKDV